MSERSEAWRQRVRAILGLPAEHRVGSVRYRERSSEPLTRALSPKGSGSKDYEVRFEDAGRMIIRCTRSRLYEDLVGDRTPACVRLIEDDIRPGMRLLLRPGGTGALADRLAGLVGPSGAIVSLEADAESVRFASRRYRRDNVACELGTIDELRGETDDAFDAAIIGVSDIDEDMAAADIREALRVVRPGGWVLAMPRAPSGDGSSRIGEDVLRRAAAIATGEAPAERTRWLEARGGQPAVMLTVATPADRPRGDPEDD